MAVSDLRGIGFPFRRGPEGIPAMSVGEDVIDESLDSIIETSTGERVYRRSMGVNVHSFVFENMTAMSRARIVQEFKKSVRENSDRITIIKVDATPEGDNALIISVQYMVAGRIYDYETEIQQ